MICKICQTAGDSNSLAVELPPSKTKEDAFARAKTLHAQCKDSGCLCQHRITK